MLKTPLRLAAFAATLAVAGAGAAVVGAATDATPPFQDCLEVATAQADAAAGAPDAMAGEDGEPMVEAVPGADGRASALAGLRLAPGARRLRAGGTSTWRFRVLDCDGRPVTGMEPEQGKLLHLIVVRSDLTGYQHLHPVLGRDGTWSVEVATPRPGRYRAIADFVLDGRKYVLGTTLAVPGRSTPAPLPAAALHGRTDGYEVELQRPAEIMAGEDAQLTFRIRRGGRPVGDLEPYLGAYGHLVALRAGDLAYSHVHPAGEDRAEGVVTFDTELEHPGAYRLFLQFQTRGAVHTVPFTLTAD